ncbi:MAG: S26 family signal peptidase [Patescibacteria group bacterium]|nr:S26 family signal peptidase [Patescibacteria group bacterium]
MEPQFKTGDRVLAGYIPYLISQPKIGDIIVFKDRNTERVFVKRIKKIKENRYFVEGDNRKDSLDSGKFGWIEKKEIMGKVISKF